MDTASPTAERLEFGIVYKTPEGQATRLKPLPLPPSRKRKRAQDALSLALQVKFRMLKEKVRRFRLACCDY